MEHSPTERELDLLKILWQRDQATVREVYDYLAAQNTPLAYTTVLSLLQTMERKGLVTHQAEGKAYVYSANVERDRTFRNLARSFLNRVFDGALGEYVAHALESHIASQEELDEIEAMIAERRRAAKQSSRKGPK